MDEIKTLPNNLNNGKAVGSNNVSNEMLRYCNSDKFRLVIIKLLELMINKAIAPIIFNLSILKPLIKCSTKPNNLLNNLRPLAISDTMPNLLESSLQLQLKKENIDKDKQFGFKINSSCKHTIFLMNQVIK